MKDEIRYYLDKNKLVNPTFNNNISRRSYWESRNAEWAEYLFNEFNVHNKYCNIIFSDFIRYFIYNSPVLRYYKTPEDYLLNAHSTQCNPGTRLYRCFFEECVKFVKFKPVSMTELIYCYRNNLNDRPECIECSSKVKFLGYNHGYRKFCSHKCQITNNNKLKELKHSNKSHDENIEIILKVPVELRNTTKVEIADMYLDILSYTSHIHKISNSERIYMYTHKMSYNDTLCDCGDKRTYKSQGQGYTKTCGKKLCIGYAKNENYVNEIDDNINVLAGGSTYNKGVLYILYSNSNNFYKIGVTQDPIKRLSTLKNSVPDFDIIKCKFVADNLTKKEKHLHNQYKNDRAYISEKFAGYTECFYINDIYKLKREFDEV